MPKRVVIIGTGFGGLAAGIRLAAAGHNVTFLEKRDAPGGRAYTFRQDGFTFDAGPTVITAPWLLRDLFTLAGRDPAAALHLVPLDPFYRIFFADGAAFNYSGDPTAMDANIRALSAHPGDVEGYARFLARSQQIFAKGFTELADKPFLNLTDMLRIAPDLLRLGSYRTVFDMVAAFVQDDRLRQVLSFHPLLIGGNPFTTTSIYALIHYLEREWGVWFAMGGTAAVVEALVALARDLGATFRFDAEVERIETTGKQATGVRLRAGEIVPADIVVSNADATTTHRALVPPSARRGLESRRIGHLAHSMSLVVIYFGTNCTYRDRADNRLAHHNIILGPRYRELLADIFTRKCLADDFSLYLHMPTITDPTLAPPGGEAFYVLSPVPNLAGGQDWAMLARPYRDKIMAFLEDHYLPDLQAHIVSERMIDPRYFRDDLNSYLGAGFAIEPTLTQSAWFRPHNRLDTLPNVYLVGAGTHPGAGLPGVLSSAKIAADLILAES